MLLSLPALLLTLCCIATKTRYISESENTSPLHGVFKKETTFSQYLGHPRFSKSNVTNNFCDLRYRLSHQIESTPPFPFPLHCSISSRTNCHSRLVACALYTICISKPKQWVKHHLIFFASSHLFLFFVSPLSISSQCQN